MQSRTKSDIKQTRRWKHPHIPSELSENFSHWSGCEPASLPENVKDEFPQEVIADTKFSRRDFLKIFGGGIAATSLSFKSCRRPEAYLVPYTNAPEWTVPGKALLYATRAPVSCNGNYSTPLLVVSHEGRPTFLKANACGEKKANGIDEFTQAALYDLYNPARSRKFMQSGSKLSKKQGLAALEKFRSSIGNGNKLAFLLEQKGSPSRARILQKLKRKYPAARFYSCENNSMQNARLADEKLFGKGTKQLPNFSKARRILSLDCDFLGLEAPSANSKQEFTAARKPESVKKSNLKVKNADELMRLYVVESAFSVTGGISDHRLRAKPSEILLALALVARELGVSSTLTNNVISKTAAHPKLAEFNTWLKPACADLLASKGKSLVMLGKNHDASMHEICAQINQKLAAFNKIVKVVKTPKDELCDFDGDLQNLIQDIEDQKLIDLVSVLPLDLSQTSPMGVSWQKLRDKLRFWLGSSFYAQQDARLANLHIPRTHFLEAWDDARAADGEYGIVQAQIAPLFDCLSENTLLLALLSEKSLSGAENAFTALGINDDAGDVEGEDLLTLKETFASKFAKTDWQKCLRDGYQADSNLLRRASINSTSPAESEGVKALLASLNKTGKGKTFETRFVSDYSVKDGEYFYNFWLQESPDPISKITWDNAALTSVKTARELGANVTSRNGESAFKDSGDKFHLVKIIFKNGTRKAGELIMPLLPSPGHADDCFTLPLGYGQGEFFSGDSCTTCDNDASKLYGGGVNIYPCKPKDGGSFRVATDVKIISSKNYPLALTQEHNVMEGRAIAREGIIKSYEKKLKKAHGDLTGVFAAKQGMDAHIPENVSLYKPEDRKGVPFLNDKDHQWAMSIDLNSCLGCSTCLLACQSENNIPVVGKPQVIRGREMHWIRMDRYYSSPRGREDDPELIPQPVACQQCEMAPCESVCPVNATIHTPDGLNAMAYNRCIGTRYCANNCPYKARRFNYFDYNKRPLNKLYYGPLAQPEDDNRIRRQKNNPNLTVRMRGVMEKCTYCVQRIQQARIAQKAAAQDSDQTRVLTGAVNVACQEACPTGAITFGNLLDEKDEINSLNAKKSPRNYDLLKYIGAIPRTSYLARVKNPNPKMPFAEEVGTATIYMI